MNWPSIPGSDPGACLICGRWRKAGMTHICNPRDMTDAVFQMDDLRKAFEQIKRDPGPRPLASLHHPDCAAVETKDLRNCNCEGWMFRG